MRPLLPIVIVAALHAAVLAQTTTPESRLPAAPGWNAALIHRAPGGVWYSSVSDVNPAYGAPDVIACDDLGQITVLSVYSGKWTARSTNPDGQWLAPTVPADVDPRVPGREIYVAGKAGNVHRVVVVAQAAAQWRLDSIEIAHVPAEEFHTVLAGDLLPARAGDELLAFAISGAVYQLVPDLRDGDPGSPRFTLLKVATLPGRVRDAVLIPGRGSAAPMIVGASRSGDLLGMRLTGRDLEHEVLAHEPMGLGRVARRPRAGDAPEVVYVTRDDGLLLRFEFPPYGRARREPIFAGAQGLRGVAAGRFFEDPLRESVAVYGYGRQVQIVSRAGTEPWCVETVFESEDQGHWLTVGELDGRNGTDELIATGFGGQVVLMSRPPGHGLTGVAIDDLDRRVPTAAPALSIAADGPRGTPERPWRIAVKAAAIATTELSPLNYQGGFETKSMIYETLVRRGADGRIVAGLASSWDVDAAGRVFTFRLRDGATFHDGAPVTAADVAVHFKRWVGLPEHAWLRCNDRIQKVEAIGPREVRITLDRSHALLPDLCAINPTAIRGPAALDREGHFVRPIGSGPFAFDRVLENGRILRYRRHDQGTPRFVDLVRLDKNVDDNPIDALLRDEVDAVLGSWLVQFDPRRADALRDDPRFQVVEGPGSSMTYLAFRYGAGQTASRELRRLVAASIDRDALIRECAAGHADPSTGWAAPSVTIWPQGRIASTATSAPTGPTVAPPTLPVQLSRPLRITVGRVGDRESAVAAAIAVQLNRAGLPTEVIDATAGAASDWDLRVEVTHGVPYDPYLTAVSRFLPPDNDRNAESRRYVETEPELVALMRSATETADDDARARIFAAIQARIDAEAVVVPLFAPRRIAILRAGMPLPSLDHDMYALDASWLTDPH